MNYEINDRVKFKSNSKEYSGIVKNHFIQDIELELENRTENISATAENPVFLIETDDKRIFTVNESQIEKVL